MRYRAEDVYEYLLSIGCTFEGDRYPIGQGWLTHNQHVFLLPDPVAHDGGTWFDADTIDVVLTDRWVWRGPNPLKRHT